MVIKIEFTPGLSLSRLQNFSLLKGFFLICPKQTFPSDFVKLVSEIL